MAEPTNVNGAITDLVALAWANVKVLTDSPTMLQRRATTNSAPV